MEYLYINDQYCANPEELKTLLTDPGNQKSKQFRNEVLAFFRDGILGKWCEQHGIAMQYSDINDTDDKAFKEIVKDITGNEVSGNLSSKFNEIGEFLRAEIEGKSYTITDGKIDVVINGEKSTTPIRLIFKCLKPENNDYALSFGEETVRQNWKNFNKGEEVVYEFQATNIGEYKLIEEDNNYIGNIIIKSNIFTNQEWKNHFYHNNKVVPFKLSDNKIFISKVSFYDKNPNNLKNDLIQENKEFLKKYKAEIGIMSSGRSTTYLFIVIS